MSLFSALSVAVTSVNALNSAVRVVSDNVANSANDEYNRRQTQFENLQFGGVLVSNIQRAANEGLLRDLYQQTTTASANDVRDRLFQQIDQLVGTINGQTPLVDDFENLRTTFKALETIPESDAAENDLLLAASNLQQELERLSNGLDLIENQALQDIQVVVDDTNAQLVEIDRLNARIVVETASGRPTSNLENLRDAQIAELSQITELRTFGRQDGSLSVYTSSGLVLVDAQPETLTWNNATRALTISGSNSTNLVTDGRIPDGRLAGLTEFIRTDSEANSAAAIGTGSIQKMRNQLDELAFSLADDSTARTSGSVFVRGNDDLTTSGVTSPGRTLTFTVGNALQGTVTINANDSIDDVVTAINAIPQVRGRVDGHGNLQILSDGGQFTIGGTGTADFGLATTQVAADSDLTFSYAYGMEHASGTTPLTLGANLTSFNGVVANDTITVNNATMGAAATFEVGVTGNTVEDLLNFVNQQTGMYARLADGNVLQITSDDGSLSITEGTNGGAGGTPLTGLGFNVNGTAVSIKGTPEAGFSNDFFVAESGTTPQDVSRTNIALATSLINRSDSVKTSNRTEVVQAFNASNRGMSGSGISITATDYTGLSTSVISGLTLNAETATRQAEESEVLRAGLEQSLRDEVGVDVDEEMANLTVLQNSYAATARVIDAINQMFQALEVAGR